MTTIQEECTSKHLNLKPEIDRPICNQPFYPTIKHSMVLQHVNAAYRDVEGERSVGHAYFSPVCGGKMHVFKVSKLVSGS